MVREKLGLEDMDLRNLAIPRRFEQGELSEEVMAYWWQRYNDDNDHFPIIIMGNS